MSAEPNRQGESRTSLAEDRTVLAGERTFAAWLRTGLAFLATGLAARRLLNGDLPDWQLRVLAFALTACAVACFGASAWRDWRMRARLPRPGIRLLPRALTLGLSLLLIAMSLLAGVSLWLT